MRAAVDFNDKLFGYTKEINDIDAYRNLSSEFDSMESAST